MLKEIWSKIAETPMDLGASPLDAELSYGRSSSILRLINKISAGLPPSDI